MICMRTLTKKFLRISKAGAKICVIGSVYFVITILRSMVADQDDLRLKRPYWRTLFADEPDHPDKDSINMLGALNHRTEKFDDGTDPYGGYKR